MRYIVLKTELIQPNLPIVYPIIIHFTDIITMGVKKRTPIKRKKGRGRPRKETKRPKVSNPKSQSISNSDRMKIVLLAEAGKSVTEIMDIIGCGWKTAVNMYFVCFQRSVLRNVGAIEQRKSCRLAQLPLCQNQEESPFSTRLRKRKSCTKN